MAAHVVMGTGLACGYLAWGDALAHCTKKQILAVPLLMSVLWGVVGSCVTLVDDYAARMMPMLGILAGSGVAYGVLLRWGFLKDAGAECAPDGPPPSIRAVSKAVLPAIWKPTLLVGMLGFSSGILRVLTATSGVEPIVLSAVRFSCAIAVVLLFLLWSTRSSVFEASPIMLVLLLVAASSFLLLPFVEQRYQIVLASIIDTVYLLAGMLLFTSCALAARHEGNATMLACGYGQGASILLIAAGFSISVFLSHGPVDSSLGVWLLALGTVYVMMIIVVALSMPKLKDRKPRQPDSIRMVLTVSESAVRENRVLTETYRISQREMDVLVLALTGRNAAAVAEALFLSESTVRTHLKHIYKKLGIHSKEELHRLVEELLARGGA